MKAGTIVFVSSLPAPSLGKVTEVTGGTATVQLSVKAGIVTVPVTELSVTRASSTTTQEAA